MKWNISLWQKIKALLALATVFLLVFATNKMDKNHFIKVQNSFVSVYEDRLVAKDYIFKISRLLDIKKNDLITSKISNPGFIINDSIQSLVDRYSGTKFTKNEAKYFKALEEKLAILIQKEGEQAEEGESEIALSIIDVLTQLDGLAEIQMIEAKKELDKSNRLIESSNLIYRIEIGALVLIGIIIQLFIFVKPRE